MVSADSLLYLWPFYLYGLQDRNICSCKWYQEWLESIYQQEYGRKKVKNMMWLKNIISRTGWWSRDKFPVIARSASVVRRAKQPGSQVFPKIHLLVRNIKGRGKHGMLVTKRKYQWQIWILVSGVLLEKKMSS